MLLDYDIYDIKDRLRLSSIKTTIDKYEHIASEKKKGDSKFYWPIYKTKKIKVRVKIRVKNRKTVVYQRFQ